MDNFNESYFSKIGSFNILQKRGTRGLENSSSEAIKTFVSLIWVSGATCFVLCTFRSDRFHNKAFNEMLPSYSRLKSTGTIYDCTRGYGNQWFEHPACRLQRPRGSQQSCGRTLGAWEQTCVSSCLRKLKPGFPTNGFEMDR